MTVSSCFWPSEMTEDIHRVEFQHRACVHGYLLSLLKPFQQYWNCISVSSLTANSNSFGEQDDIYISINPHFCSLEVTIHMFARIGMCFFSVCLILVCFVVCFFYYYYFVLARK